MHLKNDFLIISSKFDYQAFDGLTTVIDQPK